MNKFATIYYFHIRRYRIFEHYLGNISLRIFLDISNNKQIQLELENLETSVADVFGCKTNRMSSKIQNILTEMKTLSSHHRIILYIISK